MINNSESTQVRLQPAVEFTTTGYVITVELENCKAEYTYTDVLNVDKLDVITNFYVEGKLLGTSDVVRGEYAVTLESIAEAIDLIAPVVMKDFHKWKLESKR